MFSSLFETFVRMWKIESSEEDIENARIDLIIPISFTTLRNRLTAGTRKNVDVACDYCIHPDTRVAISSCSYTFRGAEKVEDKLRSGLLLHFTKDLIIAGSMVNTVDEAMRISEKLHELQINPRCILVVTGEIHSRSAMYIYRKVFPRARILVKCIPHHYEVQPDQIVESQRTMTQWAISNVARQVALRVLGLNRVRKIVRKARPQK